MEINFTENIRNVTITINLSITIPFASLSLNVQKKLKPGKYSGLHKTQLHSTQKKKVTVNKIFNTYFAYRKKVGTREVHAHFLNNSPRNIKVKISRGLSARFLSRKNQQEDITEILITQNVLY